MGAVLRLVDTTEQEPPAGADLLELWAEYLTSYGCSPSTRSVRVSAIRNLMRHAGVADPRRVTRDHVVSWLAQPVKQWTRCAYYQGVRQFSTWLREFGHDPRSALVEGIPKPKSPEPVARPITDAVVDRMLALSLPHRAHAYVRLGLFEALRVHEIAKLRAEDFDFTSGWLLVEGKGGVTKPIPIHLEVAKLAAGMPEAGYWFPSPVNPDQPVKPSAVSSTIRSVLRQCGSNATAHQLRDTAATRMQRRVKDIRLTQSMLRHRSVVTTQKYTAAANEDLQAALTTLDWQDVAQEHIEAPPRPTLPNLEAMSRAEIADLAAQLLAALGQSAR